MASGDVYLIAVLERHHGTGNVGLGLLRGYGLKDGAVATTVAHDSHNLIVIGTSPEAMKLPLRSWYAYRVVIHWSRVPRLLIRCR